MKTCLLIAGHWQIENISAKGLRKWRSYANLRKSTGASGERDWVWNDLLPLLRDKLIASGVQVFITDAIYHEETYSRDYDLALALHFDAGGTDSRCIISKPNPSQNPPYLYPEALAKADEFISHWLAVYPHKTGIASRQDRITEGMTDYYAWDYIKEGTPAVIIEHGNNTCPQDSEKMHNHTELIAEADVEAVRRFFGISAPEEPEKPSESTTQPQEGISDKVADELAKITRRLDDIQRQVDSLSSDRNILEDIQGKQGEAKELSKANAETLTEIRKEMKEEFRVTREELAPEPPPPTDYEVVTKVGNLFVGRWKK
jgi:hypothetical protein